MIFVDGLPFPGPNSGSPTEVTPFSAPLFPVCRRKVLPLSNFCSCPHPRDPLESWFPCKTRGRRPCCLCCSTRPSSPPRNGSRASRRRGCRPPQMPRCRWRRRSMCTCSRGNSPPSILALSRTSIAHLDSPKVVDSGLTQMLSSFVHGEEDALVVHLIGGFEDASSNESNDTSDHNDDEQLGHSLSLCSKVIETLKNRNEHFHIQTLCVLGHNTKQDSFGNAHPIISGFLIDISSGSVVPASFDRSSRCPDEIVRRARVTVSSEDPSCKGKLLETYDTHHDRFQITPCSWTLDWGYFAFKLQELSDQDILFRCSTSPLAESPDFVQNERRIFDYLISYPDWRQTFPKRRPHIFERMPDGGWVRFN